MRSSFYPPRQTTRYIIIALLISAQSFASSQSDSDQTQEFPCDRASPSFDRLTLGRELDSLRARLSREPQDDVTRGRLLTNIAILQSRLVLLMEAKRSSQSALAMQVYLSPECLGVNYFVLANTANVLGAQTEAKEEYLEAAKQFSAAGSRGRVRLAITYSELAMLYVRSEDVHTAEELLQRSFRASPMPPRPSSSLDVARIDSIAHIEMKQGRVTDAFHHIESLVKARPDNLFISPDLRSHIYRDFSELCAQNGRLDDTVLYLEKAASLQEEAGNLAQASVTFAMLGSVQIYRHSDEAAVLAFERAEALLGAASREDSFAIFVVRGYYGIFLVSKKSWKAGRDNLRRSLDSGFFSPDFAAMRRTCLSSLLAADRHLGYLQEAKKIRAELKHVPTQYGLSQATVDLMSLKRTVRSGN
ncbi:MAG: hypothetical protein ACJ746_05605 [Bryobacteraceae bacterium]